MCFIFAVIIIIIYFCLRFFVVVAVVLSFDVVVHTDEMKRRRGVSFSFLGGARRYDKVYKELVCSFLYLVFSLISATATE